MIQFIGVLSFFLSIYMIICLFRIILTWFSSMGPSRLQEILAMITDPYLNWFRRFPLRFAHMDFTPVLALGVLSLANRILGTIASHGSISIGVILAMTLQVIWGVVSFLIGLLIVLLILRLIAYVARLGTDSAFWRIVDAFAQPVVYKINRLIFKDRIVGFSLSVFLSIAVLGIGYILLRFLVFLVISLLAGLPI
ncbi:MAG: YggT family protein [Treponema sp.]|nr:YggT family protein [Treponema sp.]